MSTVQSNADKPGFSDPAKATDLADYVRLLDQLRVQYGEPSYRTLARMVGPLLRPPRVLAHSTVATVFQPGRRRLDQDLLIGIVRALTADESTVARWREAYLQIQRDAKTGGPAGVFGQLPADLATFTGRQEEIAQLIAAATHHRDDVGATTVVISAIEGMAGVGKTQLAIRTAHELIHTGHFTDAQLYVNLRGFDPEQLPADPSTVLEGFLRQLGVPSQQIPVIRGERAAMYRDQLRGRSALVLLDNAADEDQVRDLVPAEPSCLVLITSRHSLAGLDGITPHLLDTFTDAESLELLIRIAGHDRVAAEPEAAAQIVQYCDRLPLALALAAARLRSRPAWSMKELVDRLRAGRLEALRAGGREIRPVIELSYRELDEPLQRIFRLLSHHPGHDFTPAIVAALADIPDHEASNALESLQDKNLIGQPTPGRYELHDLLRVFATEAAESTPEPDPGAPLTRLANWGVRTGYAAALAINTPLLTILEPDIADKPIRFGTYDLGLAWLDKEQHNLAAIQQAAAQSGLHQRVWQLALIHKQFCLVRYRAPDFLGMHQLAVESARACGNRAAEALMLTELGGVYWLSGHFEEADAAYVQAGQAYRLLDDDAGLGSVLVNRGAVAGSRGRKEQAIELFTEALGVLQDQDAHARRSQATALMNRGFCLESVGRLQEAITDSEDALAIFESIGDLRNQGLVLGNLSEFALASGDIDRAHGLCHEQLEVGWRLDDKFLQAQAHFLIGDTQAAAGQPAQARREWREALELYEQIDHPDAAQARERLDAATDSTAAR